MNLLHYLAQFIIPIARAQETAASGNPAAALGVDWRLFVAQLINFGILLFVLWKWAFVPIAKKLEERTAKIEKSLHDADRIEKEKREFENWRQAEIIKTRQEASAVVTAAQSEAQKAKQQIAAETKAEQEKIVAQAKQQIDSEKNRSIAEAKSEIANLVTAAAEKILRKKLDAKADQELIKESLKSI